ncbi:MAG: FliH/SctL family protein [Nitrospirota bacterium]
MERKSLFSTKHDIIQPYTMVRFDEDPAGDTPVREPEVVPAQQEMSPEELQRVREAELQARIKEQEHAGYEKGYTAGYEKGLQQGLQEIAERMQRLGEIITALEHFRAKRAEELMPQLIELALDIAKKVIHKEVELDRELILAVARDAMKRIGEREEHVVIKVNPLDYEIMISHLDMLKGQSGVKDISIEPLATISPGGCYIETETGEIDARIEEQLKEVQDVIDTATHREV